MRRVFVVIAGVVALTVAAPTAGAKVLLVGSYHGVKGKYRTIQAAVNAAKPGDWVLVGPGDYKTTSSHTPAGSGGQFPAGVLITKARLHLRGMNRNTVIVDGTKRGKPCNAVEGYQNFGPNSSSGPAGLNGVMVWKADNVSVQNLTACNFLGGSGGDGGTGNEIWWNGGANSGQIGGWGYLGSYLNATSDYYNNDETTAAQYGIFTSNWSGGSWYRDYTSNFNDSGFYIGACQDVCDQTVNDVWSEYSALGYSGSNSGGRLVVENSQFDQNEDGFDTNSQNGDNPPPQDGMCPNGGISPITHTHSCWVFMHNYVHDNNNPNVPALGTAAAGPVGTGMSVSGARDDTIMDNRFVNNDAWGMIVVPYPDSGPPCTGGTQTGAACLYDEWGDAVLDNKFSKNGGYGNPTNGDLGFTNFEPNEPTDCFSGNTDTDGTFSSAPSGVQQTYPQCTGQDQATPSVSNPESAEFTTQAACDSQISFGPSAVPCPPGNDYNYPRATNIVMHPLPPERELPTMPNPCSGVPANPWCSAKRGRRAG